MLPAGQSLTLMTYMDGHARYTRFFVTIFKKTKLSTVYRCIPVWQRKLLQQYGYKKEAMNE